MAWNWLKRLFGQERKAEEAGNLTLPQVQWLGPADNPWGVPVLDVRPVTLGMLSVSKDQQCALNSLSFAQDDGTGFIGVEPRVKRQIAAGLRFRIDRMLADGALFIPSEMEHKWALYYHQGQIICIRSWLREVEVVADAKIVSGFLEITALRGTFVTEDEEPQFSVRVLDFLLRSHALGMVYPAPLLPDEELVPPLAAHWCMSCFGNLAHFATTHALPETPPDQPLRTHSLLHIAAARGDVVKVHAFLDSGLPVDLLAADGLAPLHWSFATSDFAMAKLLLERGSSVDVRSAEGATPLMSVAQERRVDAVAFLLDHGANPNAADNRGFTALHRAAEMGERGIVQLLLDRGASPHPEAQGHTPRSLAVARGETAIVELLDRR